ncbi:MAG: hypothetical protein USCAAHI_01437 [Beijerinckiaceae bacterium]|nr:MAG: hypothetical protein USCAAHI_01437 [Beijerinckiaceae bacterium]
MPHCLLAGIVSAAPKSNPFPSEGRPYASVVIDADNSLYRVIAYDDTMPELESLQKGDERALTVI